MDDFEGSGQWRWVQDGCAWAAFWIAVGAVLWTTALSTAIAMVVFG